MRFGHKSNSTWLNVHFLTTQSLLTYGCEADACFQRGSEYLFVFKCPFRPPKTGETERFGYSHYAAPVSSAFLSCSSRGWIAVSWRWIWSIRSINRDYCNPRGQKEGTGPLRVHASHTSSIGKSVQEWQTCASGVKSPATLKKIKNKIGNNYLWFALLFACCQRPAEQEQPSNMILGPNAQRPCVKSCGSKTQVRWRNYGEIKLLKGGVKKTALFKSVLSWLS